MSENMIRIDLPDLESLEAISQAFSKEKIDTVEKFRSALKSYSKTDLRKLATFIYLSEEDLDTFFNQTLPFIVKLCLCTYDFFPTPEDIPIMLLKSQSYSLKSSSMVKLNIPQASCILAHMFLCSLDVEKIKGNHDMHELLDFSYIFSVGKFTAEKLRCYLFFFQELSEKYETQTQNQPSETIAGNIKKALPPGYLRMRRCCINQVEKKATTNITTRERLDSNINNNKNNNNNSYDEICKKDDNTANKDNSDDNNYIADQHKAKRLKAETRHVGKTTLESGDAAKKSVDERLKEWKENVSPLKGLEVCSLGRIEDRSDCLMADFANEYIGGGVLETGCVQEEILFAIYPLLTISVLFFDRMRKTESIRLSGFERICNYSGYGSMFGFEGRYTSDCSDERHSDGSLKSVFTAFDAKIYNSLYYQTEPKLVLREITKAYVAFSDSDIMEEQELSGSSISTGNWGCGVFGGNDEVKSLIQWMAASIANKDIIYYSFGRDHLDHGLPILVQLVKDCNIKVGQLFTYLINCDGQNENVLEQIIRMIESGNVKGNTVI